MLDWRPSLLQHMPKLQRCCNVKEACLRIATTFHIALWGQDAFYIWVRTQEVIIFLSAWGRFPCFHSATSEHEEPISVSTVHLFPYWRLKCHARQTYWDPLSLWRMLAAISSQPWCSLFTLGLVYFHMLEMYEPLSCVLFFESSPETHASMNQKGCSLSVHSTPHLIQVLSAQWYVTWTQTLTVWFLSRVTSLPSAKVFPGVDILGIDPESHFQICDLLCQGHRIWLASLGNKLVQVYSSGPMDSGRLWLPWLGDL